MWKDIHLHVVHYLFLLSILFAGISAFFYFNPYPVRQFYVVIITGVLYVIWGIAHHALDGDLYPKVVVEYSLIALLAIVILRGVLFH